MVYQFFDTWQDCLNEWVNPSQGLYLHRTQHRKTEDKKPMHCAEIEPAIAEGPCLWPHGHWTGTLNTTEMRYLSCTVPNKTVLFVYPSEFHFQDIIRAKRIAHFTAWDTQYFPDNALSSPDYHEILFTTITAVRISKLRNFAVSKLSVKMTRTFFRVFSLFRNPHLSSLER